MTREGRIFAGLALVVLLAAFNTGLNILYIAFGAMVGLIVLSWPASRLVLRGATGSRQAPLRVMSGAPFSLRLQVANLSRLPVLGLILNHGVPGIRPLALEALGPGEIEDLRMKGRLDRRGVQTVSGLTLETRYPFGLIRAWRPDGGTGEILVLPRPLSLQQFRIPTLPSGSGRSRQSRRTPGDGLIFLGVREHHTEDGVRRIHWKSTARRGRLMVREFEREAPGPVSLLIDPETPMLRSAATASGTDPIWERRVSAAAAVSHQLLKAGVPVRIVPGSPDAVLPLPAFGLEEFQDVLAELARLERDAGTATLDRLQQLAPRMDPGENPVLLTGGEGPQDLASLADRLLRWRHPIALVLDDEGVGARLLAAGLTTVALAGAPEDGDSTDSNQAEARHE